MMVRARTRKRAGCSPKFFGGAEEVSRMEESARTREELVVV